PRSCSKSAYHPVVAGYPRAARRSRSSAWGIRAPTTSLTRYVRSHPQILSHLLRQRPHALQHPPDLAVVGVELLGNILRRCALQAHRQDLLILRGQSLQKMVELVNEGDDRFRRRLLGHHLQDVLLR